MKAKDLRPVYSWESRKTVLQDQVLFIPKYYQEHHNFGVLDFSSVFKNLNEVIVEYCSGNGAWIVDKAQKHPLQNWIAVEKRFERVQKIWSKAKNLSLDNLLIVYGDAFDFTKYYLSIDSISGVYVNFPDPWPKGKHAKHRLLQKKFLDDLKKVAGSKSSITITTDDKQYCEQICLEMADQKEWYPSFSSPFYITDWPDYGSSFFDALWRSKGREIYYLKFTKL